MSEPRPTDSSTVFLNLEGTLLPHGATWELVMELVRTRPNQLPELLYRATTDRTSLNAWLMDRVAPDPRYLPYRPEVLEAIRAEQEAGRRVRLVTRGDLRLAQSVTRSLGFVDEATTRFEPRDDFGRIEHPRKHVGKALFRALRPLQWVKNALVFVPLLSSHQVTQLGKLFPTVLAFIAFCLTASSVYVTNDLFDLAADRAHPSKRQRPFAAGDLSIPTGLVTAAILVLLAYAIALPLLPVRFVILLSCYLVVTLVYSFYLKRKLVADVVCLASLYTVRVMAGGAAAGIETSAWLMAFSMFLFLSLAFLKRYVELQRMTRLGVEPTRRGYIPEDMDLIMCIGPALGAICVLVLCLYVNSPDVLKIYKHPKALWLICPLLFYWVMRVWFIAHRGKLDDDPVVFALTDRKSVAVIALCLAILLVGGYA